MPTAQEEAEFAAASAQAEAWAGDMSELPRMCYVCGRHLGYRTYGRRRKLWVCEGCDQLVARPITSEAR